MIPACPPRSTQFDGHQVVGLLYGLDLMIWWRVSHNLRIIEAAKRGERDRQRLCSIAIAAIGGDRQTG
jgi:hypothetical protein